MKPADFLDTLLDLFNDLDNILIDFLNETDRSERQAIYKKLVHINDETIDDYHTLVKLILEAAESDESDSDQVRNIKRLFNQYQESLVNLQTLLQEIKTQLPDSEYFENLNQTMTSLQILLT
jgi:hypothetical protein